MTSACLALGVLLGEDFSSEQQASVRLGINTNRWTHVVSWAAWARRQEVLSYSNARASPLRRAHAALLQTPCKRSVTSHWSILDDPLRLRSHDRLDFLLRFSQSSNLIKYEWIPFRLSDPEPLVKTKFDHFLLWGLRRAKCLLLPSCVRRVSSRSMVAQPSSSFLSVWQLHSFRSKRLWGVTLLPGTKKETFDELHLTAECCLFMHVCLPTAFTTSGNSHYIVVKTLRFWTFCLHPLKETKQSQQKMEDVYHLIDRIV